MKNLKPGDVVRLKLHDAICVAVGKDYAYVCTIVSGKEPTKHRADIRLPQMEASSFSYPTFSRVRCTPETAMKFGKTIGRVSEKTLSDIIIGITREHRTREMEQETAKRGNLAHGLSGWIRHEHTAID